MWEGEESLILSPLCMTGAPMGQGRHVPSTGLYLVQDILLGAQVEMWQDASGANVGHRQAWLGDAHWQDGSWLPLAEPWETGREGGKASCEENGDIELGAARLRSSVPGTLRPRLGTQWR